MENERRRSGWIKPYHDKLLTVVRFLDGMAIYASLWGATKILSLGWHADYALIGLTGILLYEFFAEHNEVYYTWRGAPISNELFRVLISWFLAFVFIVLILFLVKQSDTFSRLALGIWFVSAYLGMSILVCGRKIVLRYIRSLGHNTRTVAIIGANTLGERLLESFKKMPWLGYKVVGFYDDRIQNDKRISESISKIIRCGSMEDLYDELGKGGIDVVYITLPMKAQDRIVDILNRMADTTVSVFIIPDFFVFDLLHARWRTIQGIPIVSVYDTPFNSVDGLLKRLEDILLSVLILILLAIPMLFIALGVKLSSPGPILFRQRRYGVGGMEFEMLKFRTMRVHNNSEVIRQAKKDDPRVTRFGKFLRRTSLDELPQFINVLGGSMSIVGPRPHATSHNEYYRKQIYGYMLRHKVRPGITGLAQVSGFRGETDTLDKMEGRIKLDLEYIRNWSLWLDVKIILKTLVTGFTSDQAY